ncbi:hypothetical protein RB653_009661 [Dictyostelium firmibasis]|uniref:Uncharacterized protein n=1 Tax=Dictyostelium firmibasis TaxID=79012 RepID=A0AAN7U1J3_9MYCE
MDKIILLIYIYIYIPNYYYNQNFEKLVCNWPIEPSEGLINLILHFCVKNASNSLLYSLLHDGCLLIRVTSPSSQINLKKCFINAWTMCRKSGTIFSKGIGKIGLPLCPLYLAFPAFSERSGGVVSYIL